MISAVWKCSIYLLTKLSQIRFLQTHIFKSLRYFSFGFFFIFYLNGCKRRKKPLILHSDLFVIEKKRREERMCLKISFHQWHKIISGKRIITEKVIKWREEVLLITFTLHNTVSEKNYSGQNKTIPYIRHCSEVF